MRRGARGYTAFNAPGDRRFDDSVRDFYTLVDHGHLVAPLGNSDTHDLNWVLDGTTRNYVFVDDTRTNPLDEAQFVAAIRAHRVVATSGPWLDIEIAAAEGTTPTVGPGQSIVPRDHAVWADVTVSQTRSSTSSGSASPWAAARRRRSPSTERAHVSLAGRVEIGDADTWIGITATAIPPCRSR